MEVSSLPVLRPLRLGELFDQAIRLYRRNFLSFVGIIALVYIPFSLLQIVSSAIYLASAQQIQADPSSMFSSPAYWLSLSGNLFSALVYAIFVTGLGTAGLTNAISRNYLGQKTGILEAYQQLGSSSYKLLLTLLLFGLLYLAAFIWTIIPCVGWLSGPGLLIFLAGIVGQLIAPVVVIEKISGTQAMSRAWNLARRRFWWLVGFAIILYLFNLLVVSGPTALISYFSVIILGKGGSLENLKNIQLISTLIGTIAGDLVQLIILPIQLTAWTLVYFDLRVRTEGFDLALLTLSPTTEDVVADMSSLPTAAPAQKWLTGDDIGKFVAVSIIGIGLYFLFIGIAALGVAALGGLYRGG